MNLTNSNNIIHIKSNEINQNIIKIKSYSKKKVIAVVKSNAYGHGIGGFLSNIEMKNIDMIATNNIESAFEILQYCSDKDILILNPLNDITVLANKLPRNFIYTIESIDIIKNIEKNNNISQCINAHLKVNSSLNRFGMKYRQLKKLPLNTKKVTIEGIYSHLPKTSNRITKKLIKKFDKKVQLLESKLGKNLCSHILSSYSLESGYISKNTSHVRVGNLIYGLNYKSIINSSFVFESKVISILYPKLFSSLGYNNRKVYKYNSKLAIIPLGYFDYPFLKMKDYFVLINGEVFPIVKPVYMNSCYVDISKAKKEISIGDTVSLINNLYYKTNLSYISRNSNKNIAEIISSIDRNVTRNYY